MSVRKHNKKINLNKSYKKPLQIVSSELSVVKCPAPDGPRIR